MRRKNPYNSEISAEDSTGEPKSKKRRTGAAPEEIEAYSGPLEGSPLPTLPVPTTPHAFFNPNYTYTEPFFVQAEPKQRVQEVYASYLEKLDMVKVEGKMLIDELMQGREELAQTKEELAQTKEELAQVNAELMQERNEKHNLKAENNELKVLTMQSMQSQFAKEREERVRLQSAVQELEERLPSISSFHSQMFPGEVAPEKPTRHQQSYIFHTFS